MHETKVNVNARRKSIGSGEALLLLVNGLLHFDQGRSIPVHAPAAAHLGKHRMYRRYEEALGHAHAHARQGHGEGAASI